jgi:hypothetical protein
VLVPQSTLQSGFQQRKQEAAHPVQPQTKPTAE